MDYRPAKAILELGDEHFDAVRAAVFPAKILRFRNQEWAERVGLGELDNEQWIEHFCGFKPLPDNLEQPLALRYHGHQFRVYNPELGDGRGFLFAQLYDDAGRLLDLATKGSGRTPYSRLGDGRLTLKGGVREVLASEFLEALGVNTSKSFSLIETGEELERHDEPSPTRSAVLVRLSHSHIRIGTFQRLAYQHKTDEILKLMDYCLRHYGHGFGGYEDDPQARIVRFLEWVSENSARLVARYMIAGFVHGVLNSDNINITGESFDYGPYRFLPTYDNHFTAAYFDHTGLYAYGAQPQNFLWSLERLAECFMHWFASTDPLEKALGGFGAHLRDEMIGYFFLRLGLSRKSQENRNAAPGTDEQLVVAAVRFLEQSQVGFQDFFFDWYAGARSHDRAVNGGRAKFYSGPVFDEFRTQLEKFAPLSPQKLDHPYFARKDPVNLLIDEINELIWEPIAARDDWSRFEEKVKDIRQFGQIMDFRPQKVDGTFRPS